MDTLAHIWTHMQTYGHICTHTDTHADTHADIHADTHADIHAHTCNKRDYGLSIFRCKFPKQEFVDIASV